MVFILLADLGGLSHALFQEAKEMSEQTIELDCAPGGIRPGDLILGVLEGTGLEVRETTSRSFGNWVWDYSDVSKDVWDAAQPILEKRITALYKARRIRYGSW